jgi:hypothetical protein
MTGDAVGMAFRYFLEALMACHAARGLSATLAAPHKRKYYQQNQPVALSVETVCVLARSHADQLVRFFCLTIVNILLLTKMFNAGFTIIQSCAGAAGGTGE